MWIISFLCSSLKLKLAENTQQTVLFLFLLPSFFTPLLHPQILNSESPSERDFYIWTIQFHILLINEKYEVYVFRVCRHSRCILGAIFHSCKKNLTFIYWGYYSSVERNVPCRMSCCIILFISFSSSYAVGFDYQAIYDLCNSLFAVTCLKVKCKAVPVP